nr:hypothetical protein [uncultured Rhodopila sp.]
MLIVNAVTEVVPEDSRMLCTKKLKIKYLTRSVLTFALMVAMATAAAAAPIDTTGSNTGPIYAFGFPNTATYGETFTPDASQTTLTDFSMYLEDRYAGSFPLNLRGYIATWNGSYAGTILYESATQTMNAAGTLQEFDFNPDITLSSGSTYVAFLSVSNLPAQQVSLFGMPGSNVVIPGGAFVFNNNGMDFAALTSSAWAVDPANDVWFKASFGEAVPVGEPLTLPMFGLALAVLGFVARRGQNCDLQG